MKNLSSFYQEKLILSASLRTIKSLKNILVYLFAIAILLGLNLKADAATITTTGNGNWSSTTVNAPWPGGTIPQTGDNIVIGNGFTLTVDGNRTCNSIAFSTSTSGTATGTLSVNSGIVLTVTNSITAPGDKQNGNYIITGSGTVNCASLSCNNTAIPGGSASTTITLTSTITALTISGNLTLNGTHTASGTKANNPVFDLQSGTVTVRGSVAFVFSATSLIADNTATITTANGAKTGTLILSGATPFTSTNGTRGNMVSTLNGTGATVNYNRSGNQTVLTTPYTNLTFSGSGTKTLSAATTISGAFSITGTALANLGTGLSHTANTLMLGADSKASGTWGGTRSSATYKNTNYFADVTGILTVSTSSCSAGNWTGTTSTDWNTTTNWCNGTIPTSSTDVVIPSGGNQPVIGAAAVCNSLTINSGATLIITGSNTLTVSGNWLNNGTFTANSSSVIFSGAAQTVGTGPYNNLTLSGSGSKTTTGVTVNGILSIEGTATVSVPRLMVQRQHCNITQRQEGLSVLNG